MKGQDMHTLLNVGTKELSCWEVRRRLSEKRLKQKEAAQVLGLCARQIKRLLKAYRARGAVGWVSKHRGRGKLTKRDDRGGFTENA